MGKDRQEWKGQKRRNAYFKNTFRPIRILTRFKSLEKVPLKYNRQRNKKKC
jgi:hypothetical protein